MNICYRALQPRWFRVVPQYKLQSYRNLYSAVSLGMVDYQQTRNQYENMSADSLQTFRNSMEKLGSTQDLNLVQTDDLKQMAYIASNNDDLKILETLVSKFNQQNSKLRFGQFVYGPVIMRTYHFLNKPDAALCAYMNPDLDGSFDELMSHVLLMDLLFKNKMYQEVVEVYKITRKKQYTFGKFQKTLMVLLFGALFKLNTEESYEYMLNLWQEMQTVNHTPIRRVLCFGAALALKQNHPQVALDLVSPIPNQGFFIVRSIKALATCALDRFDETLVILGSALTLDTPTKSSHTFPEDVIKIVADHFHRSNRKDCVTEFERIHTQLKNFGHISKDTIEDLLCSEFSLYKSTVSMKNVINASIEESPQKLKRNPRPSRRGLSDML